jgi:hypothetical protein
MKMTSYAKNNDIAKLSAHAPADNAMFVDSMCVITLGINGPIPHDHPKVTFQDFPAGIARIRADLQRNGFTGSIITWEKDFPIGSPTQQQAHGAFKPFCFYDAAKAGHNLVMWFDASIRVKQRIEPLFEIIREKGYLICREKHTVGEYCTDAALKTLAVTREEALQMQSCRSGVLGLNLRNPRSAEFLRQWRDRALDGVTFPGPKWSGVLGWPRTASDDPRVKGHRCDQTAASVIALKLGMNEWMDEEGFSAYFDIDRQSVRRLQEWKSA